jgi:YozE SAM-like fold
MRRGREGSGLAMNGPSLRMLQVQRRPSRPAEIRRYILARLASETTCTHKELLKPFPWWPERHDVSKEIDALLDEGVIRIVSRKPAISRDGQAIGYRATTFALAKKPRQRFVHWLLTQKDRDDTIGDIARDYFADSRPEKPSEVSEIRSYLRYEAGACYAALEAFERTIDEWRRGGRSC